MRRAAVLFVMLTLCLCVSGAALFAQSAANVLVVVNASSPDSVRVGEYYAGKRAIPPDQIIRLQSLPNNPAEEIGRADYERHIEAPLTRWLASQQAQDRILYIVLTKGIPLRVSGTTGRKGTAATVDSELTLLYRKMVGFPLVLNGPLDNPYYLHRPSLSDAKRFTHRENDVYLVTRLDGFTMEDVLKLVDRSIDPSRDGRILLDGKAAYEKSTENNWLGAARDRLAEMGWGDRVAFDETSSVLTDNGAVMGYFSLGSNDPALKKRVPSIQFVAGAIGGMFVSTDARTFREPPAEWAPSRSPDPAGYYAASPQSLTGDLIRLGLTGAVGYAAEPYVDGTLRPQTLFPAYLGGFNLAEAFYLSIPYLSWQTVVIGDPLCAPFQSKTLTNAEVEPGMDGETELPAFFSARRVAFRRGRRNLDEKAVKLALRADARLLHDQRDEARALLEDATAIDVRLNSAHHRLAAIYEASGERDKAAARYRAILRNNPQDPIALNNLAYTLAVYENRPGDALPLAEQAFALMKSSVTFDTLGWIRHLTGDSAGAAPLIAQAVKGSPNNAETRLHAAVVYAELGQLDQARSELQAALKLDPKLAERPEVHDVESKLLEHRPGEE